MKVKFVSVLFRQLNYLAAKGSSYHQPCIISVQRKFSDWHLVGAICLERKHIITQELSPLEKRYSQCLQKIEFEQSYLSDHEKRHLEDLKNAEKLKKGELDDMDKIAKQTAQDFEDASVEELNKFKPSPRVLEADIKNDLHSIQRKLDSSLVFIINQKIGNDYRWILPQAVHQRGETLRETAERAFFEICPSSIKIQMMGNAPVGYYKYKYPKAVRGDGTCGAKVFFFKAQLLDTRLHNIDVKQADNIVDHHWVTHKELDNFLQPVYGKVVQSFLYPVTLDIDEATLKFGLSDEDEQAIKSLASN